MGKNDKKPEPPPQPRPCGACSGKGWTIQRIGGVPLQQPCTACNGRGTH